MTANAPFEIKGKRIWVAGHTGMVGGAICRRLAAEDCEVLTVGRAELDLRRQADTEAWLAGNKPDAVFMAAGTVGGIVANDTYPADFIYDNAAMIANVLEGARKSGVEKLMLLGSSCIYPKLCPQPMPESALMTGPLEPTSQWYAVAKIMGVHMVEAYRRQHGLDYISVVPANLYGPGDDLDPATSHVIPALMGRILKAKETGGPVTIWGSGSPRRDFLYVDDAADALIFLMRRYSEAQPINVGSGGDVSIKELAETIAEAAGYTGGFEFDATKPDGMPLKRVDDRRMLDMGWKPSVSLADGLRRMLAWYTAQSS